MIIYNSVSEVKQMPWSGRIHINHIITFYNTINLILLLSIMKSKSLNRKAGKTDTLINAIYSS